MVLWYPREGPTFNVVFTDTILWTNHTRQFVPLVIDQSQEAPSVSRQTVPGYNLENVPNTLENSQRYHGKNRKQKNSKTVFTFLLSPQVTDSVESGPYTQLTQEELITMVVKQQTDLSRKDAKIVELEEYIDNLLVRVIDEKPSILQALNAAKPV